MKAAIIEDEKKNIKVLTEVLEKHCDDVEVIGAATNLNDGVDLVRNNDIDVLFLDIELPPNKGFEIFDLVPEITFDVIFITAHEEYALQAIKFAALDYLLKPINIKEVQAALKKVTKKSHGQVNELAEILKGYLKSSDNTFSKIVIPVNDGYNVIDLKDIVYCEACDSYTKIHITSGLTHLISKPLKEYEEMLSDKGFFRVHKSFLINVDHIRKIIKGLGAAVIMSDKMHIPVSTRKKEEFFNSLKEIMNI